MIVNSSKYQISLYLLPKSSKQILKKVTSRILFSIVGGGIKEKTDGALGLNDIAKVLESVSTLFVFAIDAVSAIDSDNFLVILQEHLLVVVLASIFSAAVLLNDIVALYKVHLPDPAIVLGPVSRSNHSDRLVRIELDRLLEVIVAATPLKEG